MQKGQAAVEFLMSYGWAILVVLVVIGALAYFGVLNPSAFVPDRCVLELGLECKAFMAGDNGISVILQNNAGRDMHITFIAFSSEALPSGCNTGSIDAPLKSGEQATFYADKIDCAFIGDKDKNKYGMTVTYTWSDASLQKIMTGEAVSTKTDGEVATGGYGGGSETLEGYWAFDTSDNPTPDSSSNNNDGTVNGATWQGSGCHEGGCYLFDGAGDYVHVANSGLLQGRNAFSITGWVKVEPGDGGRMYAETDPSSGTWIGLSASGGKANFYIYTTSGQTSQGGDLSDGEWHHVAATFSTSDRMMTYVDGVLVATNSNNENPPRNTETLLGASYANQQGGTKTSLLKGELDEVRLWSKALTPAEITAAYNS